MSIENTSVSLLSISPIDGRYSHITKVLQSYFSEYGLIHYRTKIEVKYLIQLISFLNNHVDAFEKLEVSSLQHTLFVLKKVIETFGVKDALKVKEIEKTTNHDIKAIEYYLHEVCKINNIMHAVPYIHFGLTSQDINNTAIPLLLKDYVQKEYIPKIVSIINTIDDYAEKYKDVSMLCRTHGQPASPSTFGKEMKVFSYRLQKQVELLQQIKYWAKFGGAVGNFNAHCVAFPSVNWRQFADNFIDIIGLKRNQYTTQIDNYENLSVIFDTMVRINTILVDFCRDIWSYISMEYIRCKVIKNEVGSSTMPHKVNPIHFENAEGNLLLSNALFTFLSQKLPVSRLQRDLTDSTVLRNVGVAFGYVEIAFYNIIKGLNKIDINKEKIQEDIKDNWIILGEAIQTILRKYNHNEPYEVVKQFTRGKKEISKEEYQDFVNNNCPEEAKEELLQLVPSSYIGYANEIV